VEVIIFAVLWVAVFGFAGYAIGESKGRGAEGFWWGFLLGIVGVIIIGLYSPKPLLPNSSTPMSSTKKVVDKRREAILEAIRRDPTLAQDTSPQTLARLELESGAIEKEMVLREEVEQALSQQQAEVQAKIDRDLFGAKVAETGNLMLGASLRLPIEGDGMCVLPDGFSDVLIVPGSPADRAGLQPGDVLMFMNDKRILNIDAVEKFMADASVGDHVRLHIRRGSSKMVLEVDL
jgi:C-terminal processing protease CtpA/Prc